MIDAYVLLKWLHIISSTVLFGTGAGTAYYLWSAHRTGVPAIIAPVARMVVRADYIFTGTSGIVQPLSGIALARIAGYSLWEPWLIAAYALYFIALMCWLPVVWLQIRAGRLAQDALEANLPLGQAYRRVMRWWFVLGWPAFFGLLAIFWLMIAKPS